jgi:hypothetical protein
MEASFSRYKIMYIYRNIYLVPSYQPCYICLTFFNYSVPYNIKFFKEQIKGAEYYVDWRGC